MFQLKQTNILCFLCILAFAGCAGKKEHSKMKMNLDDAKLLQETVARVTHVPDVPFGFKVLKIMHDTTPSLELNVVSDNIQIVYQPFKTAKIDNAVLKKWYETEMEMLGWDCMSQFQTDQDILLIFKRPGNVVCNIVIDLQHMITITLLQVKK